MIDKARFDALLHQRGKLLATIYQPTRSATGAGPEDLVQLRHVLEDIESETVGGRAERAMAAAIRQRIHALDEKELFGRGAGFALFASPQAVDIVRLPHAVEELVYTGDRFCLRPLFAQLGGGSRFHLLALSRNQVRLIDCEAGSCRELPLGTIGKGFAAELGVAGSGSFLQSRSVAVGGGHTAIFHGQGGAGDVHKEEFRRFVHRVDDVVLELVGRAPPPLVLAGVRYETDMFRNTSRHPNLIGTTLEGNPERASDVELCQRARDLVVLDLDGPRRAPIARVLGGIASGASVTESAAILTAARKGTVATLVLRSTPPLWGTFEPQSAAVQLRSVRAAGDDDLLDLALSYTLRSGGQAITVAADELEGGVPMVASLKA